MKTGDIVLIPFPFSELTNKKVRPAIIICETKDKYKDIVVCAISSVISLELTKNEMLLEPDKFNNLRSTSIVKIDRIVTAKRSEVINQLGFLDEKSFEIFCTVFKNLIE